MNEAIGALLRAANGRLPGLPGGDGSEARGDAPAHAATGHDSVAPVPPLAGQPPNEAPDGQIAAGAADLVGEDVATRVAGLYRELFPAVYGFVRYRVGDVALAEDLTATVFERALEKLASVREPDRVRGWLFAVARNAVVDERRRRKPAAALDAAEALEHLWIDSPEQQALQRDEWRRLLTYLGELDDRDREILGLRFAAGLTNRQVGEILGLSEANAAQIVHRAVVRLRRRFANEETLE